MGLPWVRLDTSFPRNPKILAMLAERDGYRASFVYLCGLAYSGEQGTDGFIPRYALPLLHGRPKDADALTRHRLWHEQRGSAGWTVNDWAEFQQSSAETAERARHARESARKAACSRWHDAGCGCWQEEA